jgi:putative transposase
MIEWWSKELSSYFPIPSSDTDLNCFLNLNFGLNKHNDVFNTNYYFNDLKLNDLIFDDLKNINVCDEEKKIITNYDKQLKKINDSDKFDDKKKQIKIKTLSTKKDKSIKNIERITKTLKINIYPNDKQIIILNKWFKECSKVYDFCVKKYNNDKSYFNNMDRSDKVKIFNDLYGNNDKIAPYDILSDEVRIFFSNLKSCQTNLKNNNITHFELKSKDVSKSHSIFLPKTSIKKDGFYISHLKNMKGMENIKLNLSDIGDSRLIYDKVNKQYYLSIPYYKKIIKSDNKIRVVSIDPGEKIFVSFFSEINYGHIGKNIRNKILPIEKKIRRYQRILSNKKNDYKEIKGKRIREYKLYKIKKKYDKKGKKIPNSKLRNNSILINKSHIKVKIRKCYKKIKNIVKELHNKTALYLVKNYDRILLPKFETQNMVRNKKYNKEYFDKLTKEKGNEVSKKEIKEVYKRRKLNGRVKFVLNNLSHYKFKMHLLNKCKEYGSELIEVSEEYTSKTCTVCGIQSCNYSNERIKNCKCGSKIDRDINGARNILIKNIKKVVRPWDTIHPEEEENSYCYSIKI